MLVLRCGCAGQAVFTRARIVLQMHYTLGDVCSKFAPQPHNALRRAQAGPGTACGEALSLATAEGWDTW
ncbi:hypothetical protein ABBQ38_014496 [Trebouxia sp. C0009 RCD-2024]